MSCIRVTEAKKMCIFAQAIHHYHNHLFSIRLGKPFYEIHVDIGPDSIRYGEGLQQAIRFVWVIFTYLANRTFPYVVFDIPLHYLPPRCQLQSFHSSLNPGMAPNWCVMHQPNQLDLELVAIANNQPSLPPQ